MNSIVIVAPVELLSLDEETNIYFLPIGPLLGVDGSLPVPLNNRTFFACHISETPQWFVDVVNSIYKDSTVEFPNLERSTLEGILSLLNISIDGEIIKLNNEDNVKLPSYKTYTKPSHHFNEVLTYLNLERD